MRLKQTIRVAVCNWRRLAGTAVVCLFLVLPGATRAQLTNSWIYDGSYFWDNIFVWSLGVAPSNNQAAILITNTISGGSFKSVNLDSGTPSGTMTISNLTVSAPAGLTNRLFLNRVGATPLRILNGFTIDAGGELLATNSTVRVEGMSGGDLIVNGGINLVSGGTTVVFTVMRLGNFACTTTGVVSITGGSLFVTNASGTAVLEVRSGTLTFSAGTLKADQLVVTNPCARFIHTGGSLVVGTVTVDPNLDADGDGLSNGWESQYGFDPFDPTGSNGDLDGDGMPNFWEIANGLNPLVNDANEDRDLDGLTNLQEYNLWFSQPSDNRYQRADRADSLGDGKSDYERLYGKKADTFYYDKLDRLVGVEYNHGSNGLSIAYVYDGNGNILRQVYLQRNRSGDGVPDLWKFLHGLSVSNANAYLDSDGDGWTNYQEWKAGSDPSDPASIPNLLGTTGTNISVYSCSFAVSNFVMAAGQLDGIGAEEIVIGADGNPGSVTNSLLILTQSTPTTWSTQTVAVGTVGITSIAIGQVSNSPSPAIYIGTRNPGGTGTVMEVKYVSGIWQTNSLSIGNTGQVAYVLGVRPNNDVLAHISPTNAPDMSLISISYSNSTWGVQGIDTNSSHRGLGVTTATDQAQPFTTDLRLLDIGGIRLGSQLLISALPTNAVYSSTYNAWYFVSPTGMSWSNAQTYARQYRGNLVVIQDSTKNSFLTGMYGTTGNWIGLLRSNCSSAWKWVTGQPDPPSYFNWNSGQPDCFNGNENYAELAGGTGGKWNDLAESQIRLPLVEVTAPGSTSVALVLEPTATNRLLWRGYSLTSGFTRQTNGVSIFYTFVDDKNTNNAVDAGDDIVVTEYLVNGTNYTTVTSNRLSVVSSPAAQSYGLACANILNSSNDVFFTSEPDGNVYSWIATNLTGALQRQLFDGHYAGKAWHQLSRHRGLDPGDGLAGLLVDPVTPNQASLVYWSPRQQLPQQPDIRETAPQTQIMPVPNSGGPLSTVNIRIWDTEGNKSYPTLQYQHPVSLSWMNASVQSIDGLTYSTSLAVDAMPTGTTHAVVWNALADFGAGYTNNISLRATSRDFMLTGAWSPIVSYSIAIPTDTVGDGIPDAWRLSYFPGGIPTNRQSCATCDADGTGQNNRFKYVAGLDPTNPASIFVLSIVPVPSEATQKNLLFNPVATSRTYTPEFNTNLTLSGWLPLGGYTGPVTNGNQVTITDTNAVERQKFYRIRISLP